ncbi:MAG TPA: hypothetical protein PKK95_10765 [Vicinamibacterales bacterium]|nr:hypothetical protein [Vicinamibacterales bacterium]
MGKRLNRDEAVSRLRGDLSQVLGERLHSLVVYEAAAGDDHVVHALAVIEAFTPDDLARLAPAAAGWAAAGLAVPLVFGRAELVRSLDAFPLEFSQILARHEVVAGEPLLEGLSVRREDLRRACEAQARSHLVHLREGYLEAGGSPKEVAALVEGSLASLRALLVSVARLHGANPRTPDEIAAFLAEGLPASAAGLRPLVTHPAGQPLPLSEAEHVFPGYVVAIEQLARTLDRL